MKHVVRKAAIFGIVFLFVLMTFEVAAPGPDSVGAAGLDDRILLAGLFGSGSKTPLISNCRISRAPPSN
jgi:hypothetical protein